MEGVWTKFGSWRKCVIVCNIFALIYRRLVALLVGCLWCLRHRRPPEGSTSLAARANFSEPSVCSTIAAIDVGYDPTGQRDKDSCHYKTCIQDTSNRVSPWSNISESLSRCCCCCSISGRQLSTTGESGSIMSVEEKVWSVIAYRPATGYAKRPTPSRWIMIGILIFLFHFLLESFFYQNSFI